MFGLVFGFLGLLIGIPISLGALFAAGGSTVLASSGAEGSLQGAAALGIPAVFIGVGAIVLLPLVYGLFGFVVGFVHALVYNVVAGFAGGLVLETE